MEDVLIVEKENGTFHIRSNVDQFPPQSCAAERNALLRQLVPHGMPHEEFSKVWTQLQKTGRAKIEASRPNHLAAKVSSLPAIRILAKCPAGRRSILKRCGRHSMSSVRNVES